MREFSEQANFAKGNYILTEKFVYKLGNMRFQVFGSFFNGF